jgi:hypothetical protein
LVLGLFVVEDLLDLEGHGLTWPHVGDFAEPAICRENLVSTIAFRRKSWCRVRVFKGMGTK